MVNEFCGFKHGVIGTNKMPSDTTLNNMKKADLIKLLHTAQHNYESLMWFYNNAVKVNMSQLNNNGWIPCEFELPKYTGEYNVTVVVANELGSFEDVTTLRFENIKGKEPRWIIPKDEIYIVIAWQPLPEPYQKGENE